MKPSEEQNQIFVGEVWISPQHNTIGRGQLVRAVQPKVMAVLHHLALNSTRVISNEELLETVWEGRVVTHSSIQKSINALRSALAELDDSREYISHFSKRGYQLVVPVVVADDVAAAEASELPKRPPGVKASPTARPILVAVVLIGLCLALLFTLRRDNVEPLSQMEGFKFVDTTSLVVGAGLAHTPEPNLLSGRLAYIDDVSGQSRLLIHDPQGTEWLVSTARGEFVDLAWSPSGRNIVVVDSHNAAGMARTPSFYDQGDDYYTLHIFTFDFKGKRLLEKNVLSHWQGHIASVSWWDENTVEFVATQGPQSVSARYRYNVPNQQLTKMDALAFGFVPMASSIYGQHTAVLHRRGMQPRVTFLDESERIIAFADVPSMDSDIGWLSDGKGIVVLDRLNQQIVGIGVDGTSFPVQLPTELNGRWTRLRSIDDETWVGAVETFSVNMELQLDEQVTSLRSEEDTRLSAAAFSATGKELMYSLVSNGQAQLYQFAGGQHDKIVSEPLRGRVSDLLWRQDSRTAVFGLDNQVWEYNSSVEAPILLFTASSPLELVSADQVQDFLWVIKVDDKVRNLWRIDLKKNAERQLTFGHLGAAVANAASIYFQYVGQDGFWHINKKSEELVRIDAPLPKNSQLLHVSTSGLYYVSGGYCNESDIYYYDFISSRVNTVTKRRDRNLRTVALHPLGGVVQNRCMASQGKILKMLSTP